MASLLPGARILVGLHGGGLTGIDTYAEQVALAALRTEAEVTLLATTPAVAERLATRLAQPRLRIRDAGMAASTSARSLSARLRPGHTGRLMAQAMAAALRRSGERFDAVHLNHPVLAGSARQSSARVCVAAWFYPHDLLERAASTWQHTGRRLPRSAVLVAKGVAHYRNDSRGFRHADCVVAPTRALTAQLRRRGVAATWCVAPCAPVHVGDDAVAPQRDADAELPRLLVCCGDLSHPRKNVGMAVRAVAQVGRERPLVLELIGRNADALQREIAALPAGVRCVTTGALPADQVHVRMRAADALLFPSLYEEWGYVAAEAALHGTRVVALPVYPFEELLDGPWGRCAAGVTVEAYAHAVAGVLDSPADRQAIAAAAEQHLGLDAAARRLAEIWGAGPARVGTSAQVGP